MPECSGIEPSAVPQLGELREVSKSLGKITYRNGNCQENFLNHRHPRMANSSSKQEVICTTILTHRHRSCNRLQH